MKKQLTILLLLAVLANSIFALENAAVLAESSVLWRQNENGEMCWENKVSQYVSAGTILQVSPEKEKKADLLNSTGRSKNLEFYPVKYEGKDYYILKNHVALGDTLAVVCQNAVLYTHPKISSFRNATLDAGTIAVTGKISVQNGIEFLEIQFFDTDVRYVKSRYILASKISNFPGDIQAAKIIEKANNTTDEGIRKELLSTALNLEMTEQMKAYAEKEYKKTFDIEIEAPVTQNVSSLPDLKMMITSPLGERIYLYEKPDAKSNVAGRISDGSIVIATQMTQQKEILEEEESNWYYVANESASGWIFGSHLVKFSNAGETTVEESDDEIIY